MKRQSKPMNPECMASETRGLSDQQPQQAGNDSQVSLSGDVKRQGKPKSQRRVALYARVSSDKQAQDGTIDSQVSLVRERLEADGEVLAAELCFCDDGVSGASLVRPALERLRDQAAAGALDRVYLLAPDRLARRHAHQMVLLEELHGCGVDVVFVNRPLGTTPEDQLLLQVQGVVAEYERSKILERTRRGRLHAARCGRVNVLGRAGFGYRYLDKRAGGGLASYEVIEDEACVVRQMFAWVGREGCSLAEVVRRLERLGVATRCGLKRWDRSTIWGLLTNPAYQGQAAYGKTRRGERQPRLRPLRGRPEVPKESYSTYRQPATEHITIPVPALVDADVFAAVQERLEENRRRLRQQQRGASYLLQGLVVCGCCGYAITGKGKNDPKGRRAYYHCLGTDGYRFGGRPVCRNRMQRVEDMDAAVWNDVCNLLSEPERLRQEFERRQQAPSSDQVTAEEERLRKAIAKTKQGLGRLLDIYTEGLVDAGEFQPRLRRLQDRLGKLEGDLRTLTEQSQRDADLHLVFSHMQDFADQVKANLTTADWATRREILRALVKQVEVDKANIRIVYKVSSRPFVKAPNGGLFQHCWRRVCVSMRWNRSRRK
jgi:site-specific DNA recombinase